MEREIRTAAEYSRQMDTFLIKKYIISLTKVSHLDILRSARDRSHSDDARRRKAVGPLNS